MQLSGLPQVTICHPKSSIIFLGFRNELQILKYLPKGVRFGGVRNLFSLVLEISPATFPSSVFCWMKQICLDELFGHMQVNSEAIVIPSTLPSLWCRYAHRHFAKANVFHTSINKHGKYLGFEFGHEKILAPAAGHCFCLNCTKKQSRSCSCSHLLGITVGKCKRKNPEFSQRHLQNLLV